MLLNPESSKRKAYRKTRTLQVESNMMIITIPVVKSNLIVRIYETGKERIVWKHIERRLTSEEQNRKTFLIIIPFWCLKVSLTKS